MGNNAPNYYRRNEFSRMKSFIRNKARNDEILEIQAVFHEGLSKRKL